MVNWNKVFKMWLTWLAIVSTLPEFLRARMDCSKTECIKLADPLVREERLVFPDNMNDIEIGCKTWNEFVDCLKEYTEQCFQEEQRKLFNSAVESPIGNIHQLCMDRNYQDEYLQHASCIKSTITERTNCGNHYNLLVDQVSQRDISKSALCCSHDQFKTCVQQKTTLICDRGYREGPASKFAEHLLDKALRFLQDQCANYIPNSGDCTTLTTDSSSLSDPLVGISSSSSEVHPWSTVQEVAPKEILSPFPSTSKSATTPWMPSSSANVDGPSSSSYPRQQLGTRSRPSSYGRSNGWSVTPNTQSEASYSSQSYGHTPTPTPLPEWATRSTWATIQQTPAVETNLNTIEQSKNYGANNVVKTTTPSTTWYPAAGNQMSNEVDEPNQQGLKYQKGGSSKISVMAVTLLLSAMIMLRSTF